MATELWRGVRELDSAIDAIAERAQAATRAAVAEAAHVIERAAKQRAPVDTGTLRRSIRVVGPKAAGRAWIAKVGPTAVYGRRVELGFHGTDSLGRSYNQEGRPYLGPAFAATRAEVTRVFRRRWASAMRR